MARISGSRRSNFTHAGKAAYGPRLGTEAPQSGSGFSVVDGTGLAVGASVTSNKILVRDSFCPD